MRTMPNIGIVAVGMTYLFIARELDLSVGSHLAFATTFMAFLTVKRDMDPWLAAGVVILIGIGIGTINGLAVTRFGVPSFIFTLGGLAALRGAASVLSGGITMMVDDTTTSFYRFIGGNTLGTPIPNQFIMMLVIMFIGGIILGKSKFGSNIYATGGDLEAAKNNGIATQRVKLICFALTGALSAVAGIFLFARLGMAPGDTGSGFELQVIAAIIIGGVGLYGGRGTIVGGFIGIVIFVMLTSGLILIGVKEFWDGIVSGVVILIAAGLDLVVRRSASRSLGRLGN
jgi:ribose/xylose/arabinose/galactoside ABC-type transport system permease subunit